MEIQKGKSLSIIIPVYNVEKYIGQCLDSVLSQAPSDSEIILIDDGSKDSSGEICENYKKKDNRIIVIHQSNKGISATRNVGIKNATGEKIFFIDSDDYLEDGYFDALLQFNADIVIGNYEAFYQNGLKNIRGSIETLRYESLGGYLRDFNRYFPVFFNTVWGKIYCADIIKSNLLSFPEGISMGEDTLFNTEYYKYCNTFQVVKDVAVMYRQTDGTLSKNISPKLFEWYEKSYSGVEGLLKDNGVFKGENEKHFYLKYFGDLYESITGICSLEKASRHEKLTELINTPRVQEAADSVEPTSFLMKGIKREIKSRNAGRLYLHLRTYQFLKELKGKVKGL